VDIFEYDDYKEILQLKVAENRGKTGYKSRLARAAGCPSSFISQVLHSHVQLSLDHALGIARFWQLNSLQNDFFLTLVTMVRASTPELKRYLGEKLEKIKDESQDISAHLQEPSIETENQQWTYYSFWYYAAIHMLLTIPEYRTVANISKKLKMPTFLIKKVLQDLSNMGLAKNEASEWSATESSLHLPKRSAVSSINHLIWRQKISSYLSERPMDEDQFHYTGVFTLSRADFERIRTVLIDTIANVRKRIIESPEEELVCLSCDWFQI